MNKEKPCEHCGHCPTCGRGPAVVVRPWYPAQPYVPPYYQPFPYTPLRYGPFWQVGDYGGGNLNVTISDHTNWNKAE